tara:strand:- start:12 stop:347 length:336 start_codon:yes stop_codon:yes gene_type:complete
MLDLILHFLLLALVIFAMAETMPGFEVPSYGTALMVAVVYGLINVTLGSLLTFLSLPFVILTLGLFTFVINAGLLWITDQLIEDFEIDSIKTTLIAAVVITVSDAALDWVF